MRTNFVSAVATPRALLTAGLISLVIVILPL